MMSKLKELRRIETAIKHRNKSELEWSLDYVKMRVQDASMKEHLKFWSKMQKRIAIGLEE